MFLYELQNFIKVAELLNITRAAEELGMTQSGLSKSIKGIEKELGVELFSREKKYLKLTTAGVSFFAEVNNFLINCRNLQRDGEGNPSAPTGTLSVLYTNRAEQIIDFMDFFFRINQICHERYPGISIKLKRESGYATVASVLSNKVDIGFMMQSSAVVNDPARLLNIRPIVRDIPLMVAVASTHPLAKANSVSVEDIRNENLVIIEAKGQSEEQRALFALFGHYGYMPKIAHTATDYSSLYMLVGSGYGIAVIPHSSHCSEHPGVTYVPIRKQKDSNGTEAHALYDLVMAYPKSNSNPMLPYYLEMVDEVLQGMEKATHS